MRRYETFNGGWTFTAGFEPGWANAVQAGETVRLPHTAVELPYNYFDETSYQKAFTYQKVIACIRRSSPGSPLSKAAKSRSYSTPPWPIPSFI
jgi:hypothetical protein